MNTKIIIPCHWDREVIKSIKKQTEDKKDIIINEVYGSMANGIIPHGRSSKSVPKVTKKYIEDFILFLRKNDFSFVYLLNSPFHFESNSQKNKVIKYLDWIVYTLKVNTVTISSYELMKFVRNRYPNLNIYISTIAGVSKADQLDKYINIRPSRVILHHDANRNFSDLKKIIEKTKNLNIETELMLTESCLRRCPNRKAHYEYFKKINNKKDTGFHTSCNTLKFTYPRELLKANFIRPEDIKYYEDLGIHNFKITGRSKPAEWLPKVTNAYLNRIYNGNLIRLLGIDPSIKAEDFIEIKNKSLYGFLEKFPKNNNLNEENLYCDKWIIELFKNKNFKIKDGTIYEEIKGILKLKKPGKLLYKILEDENNNKK